MIKNRLLIIIIISAFCIENLFSQKNIKELEEKRKRTQQEIEYTNNLIKRTRQEKKNSLNQLIIINKKIKAREELIKNTLEEIAIIEKKMAELNIKLDSLEKDLKKVKSAYSKMIIFAYKTRTSYDKMLFILSAGDINKSYLRLKYLQFYGEYRQKQISKMISIKTEMKNILQQLQDKKTRKEELIKENELEKQILAQDKEEQTKILNNLKKQESELLKKLEQQKKADKQLQETIKKLIAEELRKAREEANRKAKEEAKRKELEEANKKTTTAKTIANKENVTKESEFILTPEEQIVNDKFEANKGLLPWPTERGIITSSQGEHDHPVLKGIKIRNDGIYISTVPGAKVRAIFDGIVSKVLSIPGKNQVVIIRHGNYFTVYANLTDVVVSAGQKLKIKQTIGTAATDPEEDRTFVELQIWNGNIKLDPEQWIKKMN